jgi:hypothetical protein
MVVIIISKPCGHILDRVFNKNILGRTTDVHLSYMSEIPGL